MEAWEHRVSSDDIRRESTDDRCMVNIESDFFRVEGYSYDVPWIVSPAPTPHPHITPLHVHRNVGLSIYEGYVRFHARENMNGKTLRFCRVAVETYSA